MKAKKDGKLSTSPDPYGVDDISATKLGNMPENIDTRQRMPAMGEYPNMANFHMGAPPMPYIPTNMSQNYMMPSYDSVKM